MDYSTARDSLKRATIERDQARAALARVLAACDHADAYDQGQRGHWVSTNEIRAAADIAQTAGQPLPAEIWPGARA